MRTIKFRGKRLDNGEWLYGDYHHRAGGVHCIIVMAPNKQGKVVYIVHQVAPDTIGQSTGLFDKNGKEIYEGDVVTFDNNLQGISKVMFAEGCYMVVAKNYATSLTFRLANHTFVAGNIHDNPELLKQND